MDTIAKRISFILESKHLTKTTFAKETGLSQPYVSNLCLGVKVPSDRVIDDICEAYDVQKEWLRDGIGDPYIKLSRKEEIGAFLGDIMKLNDDSFQFRFVAALAELNGEEWEILGKIVEKLAGKDKKPGQYEQVQ